MSQRKRPRSLSPSSTKSDKQIFRSDSIEDRGSTFVAYFSTDIAAKDLQIREEVKSATHCIAAWRTKSAQTSLSSPNKPLLRTGHDDDGEKHAGAKLEKVLENELKDMCGVIVVARWYGGIMLGPVRFTHIEKCAREAIRRWRDSVTEGERMTKKLKADENARKTLLEQLPMRDQSIASLRSLLNQKLEKLAAGSQSSPTSSSPTTKPVNYESMSVEVLRRLEKARDSTIGVLLKKIDEAELNVGDRK